MTDFINVPRSTLRQVLEALERSCNTAMVQTVKARVPECSEFCGIAQDLDWSVEIIRALLDAPQESEPVAWAKFHNGKVLDLLEEPDEGYMPLYASPQTINAPLTDEQIKEIYGKVFSYYPVRGAPEDAFLFARAVEKAHGIKSPPLTNEELERIHQSDYLPEKDEE